MYSVFPSPIETILILSNGNDFHVWSNRSTEHSMKGTETAITIVFPRCRNLFEKKEPLLVLEILQ